MAMFQLQGMTEQVCQWCICKKRGVISRGCTHQTTLTLASMLLHYVIVQTVVLVGHMKMRKTDCSGETRLVLHVISSS